MIYVLRKLSKHKQSLAINSVTDLGKPQKDKSSFLLARLLNAGGLGLRAWPLTSLKQMWPLSSRGGGGGKAFVVGARNKKNFFFISRNIISL